MFLYLILNIGTIIIPLLYSFEKKLNFIRYWKIVFTALILVALPFVVWDIIFTKQGVWGFNSNYYLGIKIINLPLEEVLFFICIPYASVFTHYALFHYYEKLNIPNKIVKFISALLFLCVLSLTIAAYSKLYTVVNGILFLILMVFALTQPKNHLSRFYITFFLILIPFFVVNGILTGTFIDGEVVWYNPNSILGVRLGTIPIEDVIYCFNLLYMNILLIEKLKSRHVKPSSKYEKYEI